MRIGIDVQHLRFNPRGIYYYIWNIVDGLSRLASPDQLKLYLYGEPWMDEPERIAQVKQAFPAAQVEYYWDLPPVLEYDGDLPRVPRSTTRWDDAPHQLAGPFGQIDQGAGLPRWRRRVTDAAAKQHGAQLPPLKGIDVLHHTSGLYLPTAGHANVLTIHDLIPFHNPKYNGGANTVFGAGFANAQNMDLILTYSEHTRRDVVTSLGVPDENVRTIPLAASRQFRPVSDPTVLQPVLEKYGLAGRPYIIHVGALEERKNLFRLIDAFHVLKQEEPSVPHALVLGGQGEMLMMLQAKIHRMGLTPHARCLDFVPSADLPALLNGADVCVFPSLYEGFGLPPLEAMSCGTPVIAANATSLPEVVADCGLLIDPLDAREMSAAMYRLVTDKALRAELRARGLARAREFSWEKTARQTREAYKDAFSRYQAQTRSCANFPTRYRDFMREYALEQVDSCLTTGKGIHWPF
jgi:glycosyltransferase involved in cell wall biosynthesis